MAYKIYAKALEFRLYDYFKRLINYNPSSFLQNCFISINIMLTYKIVLLTKKSK